MRQETILRNLLFCACFFSTLDTILIFNRQRAQLFDMTDRVITITSRGAALPSLSGYTVYEGVAQPMSIRGAYMVRYTSDHCAYCRMDSADWSRLYRICVQNHVSVVTVVPLVADGQTVQAYAIDPHLPMSLLPVSWLVRVQLHMTPSTLLVSPSGSVLWSHEGRLDESDVGTASKMISKL